MHWGTFLESMGQDLRYTLRGLRRNPMFAFTAIFAAALGVGATTAVFSVVDRILFRALPYPQEDRLVSLGMMTPLDSNEFVFSDAYFEWHKYQTSFESVTSFVAGVAGCDLTEASPVRLGCARVEASFLPTLGFKPLAGRNFTAQEDRPNSARVALMSYGLWQSRFGRDPGVVGRAIRIDGEPVTIVGVLPAAFEIPTLAAADLLVPAAIEGSSTALRAFARLKPGVTVAQARERMEPLFERTLRFIPAPFRKDVRLEVRSVRDRQARDARTASWVLLGAVAAVLLIACANIANLLLARSMGRQRELAVRAALGAGRGRLMRQALTEATLIGIAGGVLGCGLGWALLRVLVGIAPDGIPRLAQASLDGRVLVVALACSLVSGVLAGLAPALESPQSGSLTASPAAGVGSTLLRESLVAVQLAMSLVLLASAGMLLRSLWKLESVPLGIQAEHVVTAEFTLGKQRYSVEARQKEFFRDLEAHLKAIPGVSAMGITDSLPPMGGARGRTFAGMRVEGQPPIPEGTSGMVLWRNISPGYFAALGIPIVRGRALDEDDRVRRDAVVLSESLARRLFPGGDIVGRRIDLGGWVTVVGVAADVKNAGLLKPADPEYYVPARPSQWARAFVMVRTPLNSRMMTDWLRKEFAAVDPALPVTFTTMRARVGKIAERPRFNALLLTLFAGIGALLAAIGLYGVMAFLVGRRTREIGLRMALGATRAMIVRLVLSRAARWAATGVVLGIVGSLWAARMLRALLFEAPPADPWTLVCAVVLLVVIAMVAAWIPSRRASRVDPMEALRHE